MKGPCTPTCCTLICASFFCFLLAGSEHEPPVIGRISFGAEAVPAWFLNEAISSKSGSEFTGGGRQCWGLVLKCFALKEGKSTSVTQKQMPSQREQYGSTIHLFIGTGRSPCKITPMPFTFANDSIVIHRGLNSIFPFKSVSFGFLFYYHAEAPLRIASALRQPLCSLCFFIPWL